MIESPAAVMAVLAGIAAFFFWLEKASGWKIFRYVVPLIWIYGTPVVLRNTGVLPASSGAYDLLRHFGLPVVIVLLLLSVDVAAAVRVMGKGVLVMLLGTAGIVLGAPVAYFVVHRWLAEDAWTGFGALAGSWIGGTGNLAAAAAALGTPEEQFGLAVLADTVIYVGWLPLLLISKNFAKRFNRWTGVSEERIARMEEAAAAEVKEKVPPTFKDYLNLGVIALAATYPGLQRYALVVSPEPLSVAYDNTETGYFEHSHYPAIDQRESSIPEYWQSLPSEVTYTFFLHESELGFVLIDMAAVYEKSRAFYREDGR